MDMKIGLHLRQRQQLVMTPKLQQALKLQASFPGADEARKALGQLQ